MRPCLPPFGPPHGFGDFLHVAKKVQGSGHRLVVLTELLQAMPSM